jgi:tRNA A37 methylthiotransferase MiaB
MLILYNPPSSASRKPILPMSLLALGAVVEGRHPYAIVDGNLIADPLAEIDRRIREQNVRVLGVTVMPGPQLQSAIPTCRALKAMHPALAVVWGGYFPTQHYEACLRAPYVDYVLRGHAERAFALLLDAIAAGVDPRHIESLAYRHPLQIRANPFAPIPDPNELPLFPYERVPVGRYIRPTFMGRRTLPHHSSYGCPFSCNFCAVVNMVNGRWLAESAERTAGVARTLVARWGVDSVEFYDNNFFTHEARTREFAERIGDLGIGWWGEARVDTLLKYEDATWSKMKKSGLRMVFLGAESGSDETLLAMNKGGSQTAEKAIELARKMRNLNIVPEMSFVLGNPPDPEADVDQTLAFIRRVKAANPATEIILYLYTPVPLAGELYDRAVESGFQFPSMLEDFVSEEWLERSQRRSVNLPWLAKPLRKRLRDFQVVLNAYYPTRTDRRFGPTKRALYRTVAAWRYHLEYYRHPLELRALGKLLPYQRPETAGF